MSRKTGHVIITTTLGEKVRAFVPYALPPGNPSLNLDALSDLNQQAELSLAKLNGVSGLVQSVDWLIYAAIRKEALLTSQIEGTQATLTDLFDNEAAIEIANPNDVEEVANYVRAFNLVREQLHRKNGLPISTRLLCDAHRALMKGTRGKSKQPGKIRRSQNWIGGTRPGNAAFVPPPPEHIATLLGDLEKFIHQAPNPHSLPALVRIALVHVQFETIHPFLDGNGRIGRLLIAALMEDWGLLREPLLYVSSTLKRHQAQYYQRLAAVRTDGDWESWVQFFLEAVVDAANESEKTVIDIASLINADRRKLLASRGLTQITSRLFERLPSMPRFTIELVRSTFNTSFPTANAAVKSLVTLGIVTETTGKKKNRSFGYQAYIDRLSL